MNCTQDSYPNDFLTLDYTETENGIACIANMYFVHIGFAYLCVAAGTVALLSRVISWLKPYHKYAGLVFMLSMYYAEGAALLIFNTGLPRAIMFFLTVMIITMTFGFIVIRWRNVRLEKQVLQVADNMPKSSADVKISEHLAEARAQVLNTPRTWIQRLFSLKALHGYLMTVAYYQMAGRAFVTNPVTSWEKCWVYPVDKTLGPNGELVLLPGVTDEQIHKQLIFAIMITVPALIAFAAIGISYAVGADFWGRYKRRKENIADEDL